MPLSSLKQYGHLIMWKPQKSPAAAAAADDDDDDDDDDDGGMT